MVKHSVLPSMNGWSWTCPPQPPMTIPLMSKLSMGGDLSRQDSDSSPAAALPTTGMLFKREPTRERHRVLCKFCRPPHPVQNPAFQCVPLPLAGQVAALPALGPAHDIAHARRARVATRRASCAIARSSEFPLRLLVGKAACRW